MEKETIGMASDHAGFEMKEAIKKRLTAAGYEVKDFGTHSADSCDYADYAHPLASAISRGELKRAIAFCGSGNGINMTLNHHTGVRSAYCWQEEITALARQHNDANICVMPARFLAEDTCWKLAQIFLNTAFEGGRHLRRIEKIDRF
ncbi:MAG: RpiB/LacA/LacB family sugar-phosphate isomerase [Marinilabiliaceae bacterium]|nr:RpiB/LacA/LacB family sugar-phosphate isomerase [Marinilabiliaceae bacterium]